MTNPNFLQSLGWAVINSLWQLALLWVIYQLLVSAFKAVRPAAKSLLASSLLIAGFAWFIFTFFAVYNNSSTHSSATTIAGGIDNTQISNWLERTLPATSIIYLLLLFVPLLRFIRNYRYVQVIRNYGLSKPDAGLRLFAARVAERMGIKKPVHIWISEWVTSPVTIGHLKPVILIPMAALNQLSTQQMEAVLLHELSHIRRYDYLLNFILTIIRTVLYFNPFAGAFVKIVEAERERSCDEMVLQFQYDSYEYAAALLTLEKVSREQRLLVLNVAGSGKELLSRIEKIMGVNQKNKFSLRRFSTLLTALFFIISLNTLFVLGKAITGSSMYHRTHIATTSLSAFANHETLSRRELPAPFIMNTQGIAAVSTINSYDKPSAATSLGNFAGDPDIINANFETEPVVELPDEEEAIVKEAVESSRKVLESSQWKAIEKNLADVFNKREKEELKNALKKEMNNFDWGQWENKLRLAYDKVDWEKVNGQLNDAMNKLRADSLVKVYNDAMVSLSLAQKELRALSLNGIPDSDVSLKSLADKQRELQKEISRLKTVKSKKIIHL